jgi:hypothetical protein
MLNVRRALSRSTDLSARRPSGRECWIPTAPGEGDLRSRSYPVVITTISEDGVVRGLDDVADAVLLAQHSK